MRILIAQEDESSRGMLESMLANWGHDVIGSVDGATAWQELQKESAPRLAILDRKMPGLDGLEVCREVRKRTDTPYVYLLLMTAKGQEQEMLEGLQAGADDFLTKPLNTDDLMIRLRVAKRILELQEELRRAHAAISYQTRHDPLTGLSNRAAILDALGRELARVRREAGRIAVILAEVDHLKTINETYGHPAGDAVLREAARRIRAMVRPYDTVGRYGGEEFLVIVPSCDANNALSHAERLRSSLAAESMDISEWGKFASPKEGKIRITFSVGVAAAEQVKGSELLLRAVEVALARAKKGGHNRVELAKEEDFR